MNTLKKIFPFAIIIILAISASRYFATTNLPSKTQKKAIYASFYPLGFFTQRIAGNTLDIRVLTPSGIEPHDYEPTAKDIKEMQSAALVILNGGGLEPYGEKLQETLPASVSVFDVTTTLEGIPDTNRENITTKERASIDPHMWLDPVLAKQITQQISQRLIALYPENKKIYEENTTQLVSELETLHSDFENGLASCDSRTIVTSHAAFAYLAKRYNLTQIPIAGVSPDAEPSAQQLAELTTLVKAQHISYIFFETLVSPKLSETLAKETGAKTASINPIEGLTEKEAAQNETYISLQKQNLDTLKIALQCN